MSNKRLTTNEFIKRAKEVHGDRYDYTNTKYDGSFTKIKIVCKIHGEFKQSPKNHLRTDGCKLCSKVYKSQSQSLTVYEFIKRAKEVHGNKYDYTKVNYVNNYTKIKIICKEHGEFKQLPKKHLVGRGCSICGKKSIQKIIKSTEEFIKRAKEVHGNKYSYTKTKYTKSYEHVVITCKEHGEFVQLAKNHLVGRGCPTCANELTISKSEQELSLFVSELIPNIITSDRSLISPYELDIIVPDNKLAIEFNGSFYHNFDHVGKNYHKIKSNLCEEKGYRLIHVYEYDWIIPHKQKNY